MHYFLGMKILDFGSTSAASGRQCRVAFGGLRQPSAADAGRFVALRRGSNRSFFLPGIVLNVGDACRALRKTRGTRPRNLQRPWRCTLRTARHRDCCVAYPEVWATQWCENGSVAKRRRVAKAKSTFS